MPTVPSDPTTRGASRRPNWPGLTGAQKSQPASPSVESQLTAFFQKSPNNPQLIAPGHDVIPILSPVSYPGFLLGHL